MAAVPVVAPEPWRASLLIDVAERVLHARSTEWIFFRELRVGTGRRNGSAQRVDAFALNCYPHLAMKRVCYEVKVSRADYQSELRQPLKRRPGMRFSNEFYFLTPAGLLKHEEVPADCGLVEVGCKDVIRGAAVFGHDAQTGLHCAITVPAAWRDTPGPTWEFLAAALRHQKRAWEERAPQMPEQPRFDFSSDGG